MRRSVGAVGERRLTPLAIARRGERDSRVDLAFAGPGSEETTSPVVGLTETACVADKFIVILSRCLRSDRILAYLSIH
jgi:hypothetical protein